MRKTDKALLNFSERDNKNLDTLRYSYKLSDNQYGLDAVVSAEMMFDEGRMSAIIPFADGNRRDGVGDLLEIGGIDLSRHRKNPISLFDHGKNVSLPIGITEDPETKTYTVNLDIVNQSATMNTFFYQGKGIHGIDKESEYDHAVFCEQLYDMLVKKMIRAGSIGYQVIAARELNPDYETGTPKGLHLLKTLMLEGSLVVLPANADTVQKALSLKQICGKSLSPYLVKSLSPYAGEKKVSLFVDKKSFSTKPTFKDLRKKYSQVKDFRRRLKKSTAGSSIIYVKNADLDEVKKLAIDKGLQCKWLSTSDEGLVKIKLSGDDGVIDQIAKTYGYSLKGVKSMAKKELKREVKSAPDEMKNNEKPHSTEPYGAQVLRRMHEDHKQLLSDYDDLIKPMEHEHVKKHMMKTLEGISSTLDETESLFAKHYKDLPPLSDTMDDPANEEEETATEEENVEGDHKNVDDPDTIEADSEHEKLDSAEEAVESMEKHEGLGEKRLKYKKTKDMKVVNKKCECKSVDEKEKEEKSMDDKKEDEKSMHEDEYEDKKNLTKDLNKNEKKSLKKTAKFLKDLSEVPEHDNDYKKLSFYHAKNLDEMHEDEEKTFHKDAASMHHTHEHHHTHDHNINESEKSEFAGDLDWLEEEEHEAEHEKNLHPNRKYVKHVSKFLKAMSDENVMTGHYRHAAKEMSEELDRIADSKSMDEEEHEKKNMDENDKKEKSLTDKINANGKQLALVGEKLSALTSKFVR